MRLWPSTRYLFISSFLRLNICAALHCHSRPYTAVSFSHQPPCPLEFAIPIFLFPHSPQAGCSYVFDLLLDTAPLCVDLLPPAGPGAGGAKGAYLPSSLALSLPTAVAKRSALAVVAGGAGVGVQVRAVWEGWHRGAGGGAGAGGAMDGLAVVGTSVWLEGGGRK